MTDGTFSGPGFSPRCVLRIRKETGTGEQSERYKDHKPENVGDPASNVMIERIKHFVAERIAAIKGYSPLNDEHRDRGERERGRGGARR